MRVDVDPRLHHALQLAQYTSQYLVACGDMLQSHTKSVTDAIDVFDEEEEALDMQLAKLRYSCVLLRDVTTMVIDRAKKPCCGRHTWWMN